MEPRIKEVQHYISWKTARHFEGGKKLEILRRIYAIQHKNDQSSEKYTST
jgi:hypothetical protein